MTKQYDRCKRCGKPLRDPVSRAIGFGPRCRNAKPSSSSHKSAHVHQKGASPSAYNAVGALSKSGAITTAAELPEKQSPRQERTQAVLNGKPVVVGKTTFVQKGDRWINQQTGSETRADLFLSWLVKYRFVDPIVANFGGSR